MAAARDITVIIIEKGRFVTVGQDSSQRLDTACKAAAHIVRGNVMPALADTVCNTRKRLLSRVQTDIVHPHGIAAFTRLPRGMRGERTGQRGFLREAHAFFQAGANAFDGKTAGKYVIAAVRCGQLIDIDDHAEVVHLLTEYGGEAGLACAVDTGDDGVGFHGITSFFESVCPIATETGR